MFYGEYRHSIDTKGRLIIPSKLRITLEDNYIDKFYITRGFDKCIVVYEEGEWSVIEKKLKALPQNKPDVRAFVRIFFSQARLVECDKQGRINIPDYLLKPAGIEKEVFVIGSSNRIEIWDVKSWENYCSQSVDSYEKLAESVGDLGI